MQIINTDKLKEIRQILEVGDKYEPTGNSRRII